MQINHYFSVFNKNFEDFIKTEDPRREHSVLQKIRQIITIFFHKISILYRNKVWINEKKVVEIVIKNALTEHPPTVDLHTLLKVAHLNPFVHQHLADTLMEIPDMKRLVSRILKNSGNMDFETLHVLYKKGVISFNDIVEVIQDGNSYFRSHATKRLLEHLHLFQLEKDKENVISFLMESEKILTYSIERSLSTLLGNFKQLDDLPPIFTPELQEQWKTIIEPALLKGLKDTNLHPLLLETIHELAKRKYDLNQPIFDPIDPVCRDTTIARPLMYLACAKGVDCFHIMYEMMKMENIDINATTTHGATLFWLAAHAGHLELIELLLSDPRIDPNKNTHEKVTPFIVACGLGRFQFVDRLLKDKRINPNLAMNGGITAFYIACQQGNTEVVQRLLRDDRIDPNQRIDDGWFPFLIACNNGHLEIIKMLLRDRRIDPTRRLNKWSPYYYVYNNVKVLELLLSDSRLDPNINKYGITPLSYACSQGHRDVVKRLLQEKRFNLHLPVLSKSDSFTQLVTTGEFDLLKILLKNPQVQIKPFHKMSLTFDSMIEKNFKNGVEIFLALSSKRIDFEEFSLSQIKTVILRRATLFAIADMEFGKLLIDYAQDPTKRKEISLDLYKKHFGVEESAYLFAATVLTCDDILAFKANIEAQNWFRYMQIATRLPLELQMVLVNRTCDIGKDLVAKKDLENALREVLRFFRTTA